MGTREVFFFSSLSFLFVSFLSFCPFSFFFSLFFLVWERGTEGEMAIEIFVISFLLLFLFWKRNGEKNGNEKALFLPIFLLSFLLFQTSSFSFFLLFGEGEWRGKRIEEFAPKHAKKILQEHNLFSHF